MTGTYNMRITVRELRQVIREALGAYISDFQAGPNGNRGFGKNTLQNNKTNLGPDKVDDYDDRHDPDEEDWPA